MEQVRLGIIGVGNMGSGHTANIMAGKVPEVRITAAADLRESRREWAKENMPEGTAIFEDGDSLIKSGTRNERDRREERPRIWYDVQSENKLYI